MPASFKIPSHMRAVVLHTFDQIESLVVEERPVPRPQAGQVLIRMHASPVNPSDLAFLRGVYSKKELPVVPGIEGSGTVVAAGHGLFGRMLVGRRVAFAASNEGEGTWAEYAVLPAQNCMPLGRSISLEQGAMLIVNPLTAWLLMAEAQRNGRRALVQTAAAGALGKMIVRLARQRGVTTINIVRRDEQAAALRELGATHVLNSTAADFEALLFEVCRMEDARLAFDAVGGELTGKILSAMSNGARLISYGGLALEPCILDPRVFISAGKSIEGFQLGRAMGRLSLITRLKIVRRVQQALGRELQSEIQARVPLKDAVRGLQQYVHNMSAGKVLLVMNRAEAE